VASKLDGSRDVEHFQVSGMILEATQTNKEAITT
jgi:hypothetical protein